MRRLRHRASRLARAAALSLAAVAAPSLAVERAALEAAIVCNILLFVDWPAEASWPADAPLNVCVDPASPTRAALLALDGRPIRRARLTVQALGGGGQRCHAIFVDTPASQKAAACHAGCAEGVLLIEGSAYDALDTPTIRLVESDGRLAFDIQQGRARQAGLTISSRLLRLARQVTE